MTEPLGRVAVFWHYDSLPPPTFGGSPRAISRATHDAVLNIRQALYKFGLITCFRAYVGSMPPQVKWELQSHGATVVECLWNASETMITADMFHFALDNPSPESTLVLISSSFSLAYTISVLGARRYRVALISIPDPHNNVLLAQASEVIDWRCMRPRGILHHPRPVLYPLVTQDSSDRRSSERPTGIEYNPPAGPVDFPPNVAETLEHSFTLGDLSLAGNNGERQGSAPVNVNAAQLEPRQLPPADNRPPSRQIQEAILNCPVFEDAEEHSGPRSFDSSGRSISLLTRPFTRSLSELARGGNVGTVRPRSNSLQDDRCLTSPSREPSLGEHTLTRTPLPFGGLGSEKPLNVGAQLFIPSPPNGRSEDVTTTLSPPSPDPLPTTEPTGQSRSPSSAPLTPSTCSTPSTVRTAVAPATPTTKPGTPTNGGFTKGERRAVRTVIDVLLERNSRGDAYVSSKYLPLLLSAKDKHLYRGTGSRGNRFWKLIDLGVQMGWLETGPENAWVAVGKGWTEESGLT